jgi:hypothetical protein
MIKINGADLPISPTSLKIAIMDLDDGETTGRTTDGTLSRDRIARKRQIDITFPYMIWTNLSNILKMVQNEFVDVTYPDPMSGKIETKKFYVGDREIEVAFTRNGVTWWKELSLTLTER